MKSFPRAVHVLALLGASCVSPLFAEPAATIEQPPICQSVIWQSVDNNGKPHARHEAAFIECAGKFYLLGGRRIQPVDIYDPATNTWSVGKKPPVEIHHFQPVAWEGRILLAGAMTGRYPHETALPNILIYDPAKDEWSTGPEIPVDRRRGGAGAVIHDGILYIVSGIINGHWDGHVTWLDALDLRTGKWMQLPDAPHARDHFQTAIIGGKIYAAGGRRTSGATKQVFNLTVPEVDVYDIATAKWTALPETCNIPTPRAGCMALALDADLIIAGGESKAQKVAHGNVEAFDTHTLLWRNFPSFLRGRHGSGLINFQNAIWVVAGSGSMGGSPELDTMEKLPLPVKAKTP